jgi:exonuclease III
MSSGLKIASWNICLGLSNKKDFLAYELNKERIDVCCLQECEVPVRLDEKTLTLNNYKLELETNEHKKGLVYT